MVFYVFPPTVLKLISKLFSYFVPSPVMFLLFFFMHFSMRRQVFAETRRRALALSVFLYSFLSVCVCAAFNPWPLARVVPVVPARKSCTWQLSLGERRIVAKCFVFFTLSLSPSLFGSSVYTVVSPSPCSFL